MKHKTSNLTVLHPLFFALLLLTLVLMSAGQVSQGQPLALDVPLTVKENAGVGAHDYPVSVVIPLPRGAYASTDGLGMAGIPSQVEVLERWPGDATLRHVLVHFQASVSQEGNALYHFGTGGRIAPPIPVTVSETAQKITVTTGPLRFVVSKTAFNLFDQVWLDEDQNGQFSDAEQIITPNAQNGGVLTPRSGAGPVQYDATRHDLSVTVEEWGPMRAVIRIEAPARFTSTTDHLHGFAARIYAYAGLPWIKLDYQLQNSDKNAVRSWPLYFEAINLDLRLNLAAPVTARFGLDDGTVHTTANDQSAYLAQEMHNHFALYNLPSVAPVYSTTLPNGEGPEGFIDVSNPNRGVMAAIRNFWQMWPNGLAVDAQHKLSLQLWPAWSAQYNINHSFFHVFNPTGLYWIDDMQHTYKEVLLVFHAANTADVELINLARTFQFYPVAVVPTDWYRTTMATLDLGGVIPDPAAIPAAQDRRLPTYLSNRNDLARTWYNTDPNDGDYSYLYGAGWVNFLDPEPGYRTRSCTTGGWPYSDAYLIATGNPGDFFDAEGHGQAELNLRPQWMTSYTHAADWDRLRLTENPYCFGRWRLFEGWVSMLAADPLPDTLRDESGTSHGEYPTYSARDDEHGWFYHVAESYWLTGNPWIRDWYTFVAEFRRTRLERLDPFPDRSSRATGHALGHVLQAARVTGNVDLLDQFGDHLRLYLRPEQDPYYGDQRQEVEDSGGGFQTGYLMRTVVDYLEEARARGDGQAYAEGFNYLSGLIEWNYHYGNFPYYFNARTHPGETGQSDGSGLSLVDPVAWYYWHTGLKKYWDHLETYVTQGINGGERPYGQFDQWQGQWEGRYYQFVKHQTRSGVQPPAVANLTASRSGSMVTLCWTAPAGAERYHVVWSGKPIVAAQSLDSAVSNWWAANAIGLDLTPTPGQVQGWRFEADAATPVHAALFSFDLADNMSPLSNVAQAVSGAAPCTPPNALTVFKAGTGTGTITSNPAGITCGSDCTQFYNAGAGVALGASPTGGSTFAGWSGACSGTGACQVTMNAARSVTATFNAGIPSARTAGLYSPASGTFYLRTSNAAGVADLAFRYGPAHVGWVPLVGDWDGNGTDTVGLYSPASGTFYLRNSNSAGVANMAFRYGPANVGWIPLVGDWDGNGTDTVGLFNPATGTFYLRNSNSAGVANVAFRFGPANAGWVPLVGDWDGNGTDTVGLFDPVASAFYLRNSHSGGTANVSFRYGPAGKGWAPLMGDWDGNGIDTAGLFDPAASTFYLRNSNSAGVANLSFRYGPAHAGWIPLAGDWNGPGL